MVFGECAGVLRRVVSVDSYMTWRRGGGVGRDVSCRIEVSGPFRDEGAQLVPMTSGEHEGSARTDMSATVRKEEGRWASVEDRGEHVVEFGAVIGRACH